MHMICNKVLDPRRTVLNRLYNPSKLLIALALAPVLLLAACGPATQSTVEVTVPVTVEVPANAGSLVVYSGRSETLVAPIIAQFADATGIEVQVRYGSTPEMAAALLEEGANSPADVFFAQDPGGLGAVAAAGLLAPLPEDLLNRVPPAFRAPDNNWVGISGRARVVIYNTEKLTPADLPGDIWDFTDPSWSGRIGWVPSNGSFQAMVTAMRSVWGEDRTREWLTGMVANRPAAYENNTAVVAAVGAGEVDAGFVNHYYVYQFLAEQGEEFPARNYFLPSGGPGSLLMMAGAGRLANGPNAANGEKFIEFMLSQVAQQYFASKTYEYPLVEGVSIEPSLTPLAELNSLDIKLEDLADLAGTTALLSAVGVLP
jgi:iron(III) transport system substrate-binding protein